MLSRDIAILDVGAGRLPTIPVPSRPPGCEYVALDIDAAELQHAGPDAYSSVVVANAIDFQPTLEERFDLVVSCHTFEHIRELEPLLKTLRRYIRPGGHLMALFSGRYAAHALANRALPESITSRLTGRPADTKFVAHYDRCYSRALGRLLTDWSHVQLTPLYVGANYLVRFRLLQRLYVAYEDWAVHKPNLASHYILVASP